ncbi:MAG: SGNH/GDSL hydrolase family protein [Rhodospirillales bacterium]|nr:MAG: SGNH/GDSL hydrolase family protein [Rhodospirillales bacterium]
MPPPRSLLDSNNQPPPCPAPPSPTRRLWAGVAVALAALTPPLAPARAAPEKCPASAKNLELGAALPVTRAALRERKNVVVVALGSSSTQGHGATSEANTFPRQMDIQLRRRYADVKVGFTVLNRGVGGQDVDEMMERMDRDVLAHKPDLLIWQVGTNAAMRGMPVDVFRARVTAGVRRAKAAGADVVLMTPQYVPAVVSLANEEDYITALEEIARETGAGLFRRWGIMREWVTGERMPYAQFMIPDGLHLNDFGQRCIGKLIAKSIERAMGD